MQKNIHQYHPKAKNCQQLSLLLLLTSAHKYTHSRTREEQKKIWKGARVNSIVLSNNNKKYETPSSLLRFFFLSFLNAVDLFLLDFYFAKQCKLNNFRLFCFPLLCICVWFLHVNFHFFLISILRFFFYTLFLLEMPFVIHCYFVKLFFIKRAQISIDLCRRLE